MQILAYGKDRIKAFRAVKLHPTIEGRILTHPNALEAYMDFVKDIRDFEHLSNLKDWISSCRKDNLNIHLTF